MLLPPIPPDEQLGEEVHDVVMELRRKRRSGLSPAFFDPLGRPRHVRRPSGSDSGTSRAGTPRLLRDAARCGPRSLPEISRRTSSTIAGSSEARSGRAVEGDSPSSTEMKILGMGTA